MPPMNRRRKASNAPKPPAQPAPPPVPSAPAPSPAPPAALPARVSPPPKAPAPPQNVPTSSKFIAQPTPSQPRPAPATARPSVSPPKAPAVQPPAPVPAPIPQTSNQKAVFPGFHPQPRAPAAPAQKKPVTRSDRVRTEWREFDRTWVAVHRAEVGKQLDQLLAAAQKNPLVKGAAFDRDRDGIINSVRRDFAMSAREEWDGRLAKAGLEAEDWMDMTQEEMFAVEEVLAWDDSGDAPSPAPSPAAVPVAVSLSGRTAVEPEQAPLNAAKAFAARSAQAAQSAAAQKGKATAQSQSAWNSWAPGPRHVTVTEVPEEQPKPTSAWGAPKNGSILEEVRAPSRADFAPPMPPQPAHPIMHAPQHSAPKAQRSASPPAAPALTQATHGLLTYPVPISLTMTSLNPAASADAALSKIVDNLFATSIRQFHEKAGEADAELARQLRKPMPVNEREWLIRAHTVLMEQTARDIVQRRDALLADQLRKRGLDDSSSRNGGGPMPMPAKSTAPSQPPGAFPDDDGVRVVAVPEPEAEPEWSLGFEPEPEPEREPEPDVDEVIEIPLKGKAKKKAKKAAETAKAATNGRATPAPAPKVAAPAPKVAPAVEKKPAATMSAWGTAAKVAPAAPVRSSSPAPITINTKVAPTSLGAKPTAAVGSSKVAPAPTTTGRGTPIPAGMSPWEAAQAAKAAKAAGANFGEALAKPPSPPIAPVKPPSPPNGMWAPPPPIETRRSSSKNPYAPTRPSRLGQVADPEPPSPEPPSPPPTREPTGQDYVAWFAGSSSEDEGGAEQGLSEDEDDEDEDEDDATGAQQASGLRSGIFGALAGASPWALFGAGPGSQPQKERGRTADPARGRATPTPAKVAAARFGANPIPTAAPPMGAGSEWMRWGAGAPTGFGTSPPGHGYAAPGSGFGMGTSPPGFPGAGVAFGGPSAAAPRAAWAMPMKAGHAHGEDGGLDMLDVAAEALNRGGRGGGGNVEEVMAMYVTAQLARESAATPVGGRTAGAWRR